LVTFQIVLQTIGCGTGLFLAALVLPLHASGADQAAWDLLRQGGVAVLVRHANAPGTGDPAHFRLDDCATQRNLSEEGRRQARALGEAFRREQVAIDAVYSSQWCRCKETAALAFGSFEEHPPLNSFFGRPGETAERLRDMQGLLDRSRPIRGVLVLVTHQVNITALTGLASAEGEVVVARIHEGGRVQAVARVAPGR